MIANNSSDDFVNIRMYRPYQGRFQAFVVGIVQCCGILGPLHHDAVCARHAFLG